MFDIHHLVLCALTDQAENYMKGGTMSNIIHRMNLSLGERGDRLSRAEDRTVELMQKASQFADTAHKVIY